MELHLQHDSEQYDTTLADAFMICVAKWYCLFYGVAFHFRPCMRKNRRGIYYAYHIFDEIKELSPLLHEYVMKSLESSTQSSTQSSIPGFVFTKINWLCSIICKEGTHTEIILAHIFRATFIELFQTRLEPGEEMMSPIDCELHQDELYSCEPFPDYNPFIDTIRYRGFFSTAYTDLMHEHVISKEARRKIIDMVGDSDIVSILLEELEPLFTDDDIDRRIITAEDIERIKNRYSLQEPKSAPQETQSTVIIRKPIP